MSTVQSIAKSLPSRRRGMSNMVMLICLAIVALVFCYLYMTINVSAKYPEYAFYIRQPKLWSMLIAAFCIGTASVAFQSVIRNTIVTPCLLGMNSLYSLINTTVYFFLGLGSFFVYNKYAYFSLNLLIMAIVGTAMYGFLFKKTNYNVLYVLLAGTVLTNLFGSMQTTMVRIMDPVTYDTLLSQLIAGFDNVNTDILLMATVLSLLIYVVFWRYIRQLDVICLGKNQAINLGVDYDKSIGRILLSVVLLIAIATACVGPLSFLGLILSNLARQMFRTYRHFYLMIGSFFIGIILLVGAQLLVEHVFSFSASISVFISIFGGTYFLYLIVKNKGA